MFSQRQKQQGVFALTLALVMLLIMGLFALLFELRSVQKYKIVESHYRGEQALNAAEAGLNYGVAYVIETPTGATTPNVTELDLETINTAMGSGAGEVTSVSSSEQSTNVYKIISTGQSADGLASRTIEHVINVTPQDPDSSGYDVSGWKDY